MSRHRKGELGVVPLRSGRFFYIDSKWYFSCREGKEKGPFDSKEEAERALLAYIAQMEGKEAPSQEEVTAVPYQPAPSS